MEIQPYLGSRVFGHLNTESFLYLVHYLMHNYLFDIGKRFFKLIML